MPQNENLGTPLGLATVRPCLSQTFRTVVWQHV